jgi:hypothetical protein
MKLVPLLILIDSSEEVEILKEDLQKYLGRKKTGNCQLEYINDIHVIDILC